MPASWPSPRSCAPSFEARLAGVQVIGLIGGRAGCYGGGGLIAGCCSALIVSEQGRISVSGPEVIETNKGVEEFDSRDRALVWRTMGGKHRYLIGGANRFVDDSCAAFREAALAALSQAARFDLDTLAAEQARLEKRLARFGDSAMRQTSGPRWHRPCRRGSRACRAILPRPHQPVDRRPPMTLDEILASLFPAGREVRSENGRIAGQGDLANGRRVHVLGLSQSTALGVDDAVILAGQVLEIARTADGTPILMLIDSSSQRMSRRDELLGLNEYLAHLAKSLLLAEHAGHRTIGLLYGGSAAGAFIATALATGTLVALPGAHPAVMDLPSMARVTKLSIDVLREKAKATPVFAPGLDNLARMGAVHEIWDPERPLATQLEVLLARPAGEDTRDVLGQQRKGRPKAAAIAVRVAQWAQSDA